MKTPSPDMRRFLCLMAIHGWKTTIDGASFQMKYVDSISFRMKDEADKALVHRLYPDATWSVQDPDHVSLNKSDATAFLVIYNEAARMPG